MSGKGHNCPVCGANKFHKGKKKVHKALRRCSSCGTIGWIEQPDGTGGGKGKKCGHCLKQTLHTIYDEHDVTIRHCSSCNSIALDVPKN